MAFNNGITNNNIISGLSKDILVSKISSNLSSSSYQLEPTNQAQTVLNNTGVQSMGQDTTMSNATNAPNNSWQFEESHQVQTVSNNTGELPLRLSIGNPPDTIIATTSTTHIPIRPSENQAVTADSRKKKQPKVKRANNPNNAARVLQQPGTSQYNDNHRVSGGNFQRDRPYDSKHKKSTVGPTNTNNRISTHTREYANPLKKDLVACVINADRSHITSEQADRVMCTLRDELSRQNLKIYKKRTEDIKQPCLISTTYKDGTLQMLCENKDTLEWVHKMVPNIQTDHNLQVVTAQDLKPKTTCSIVVPTYTNITFEDLMIHLYVQNPWAQVEMWNILLVQTTENNITLTVDIPKVVIPLLQAREKRLAYLLQSVFVHFQLAEAFTNASPT